MTAGFFASQHRFAADKADFSRGANGTRSYRFSRVSYRFNKELYRSVAPHDRDVVLHSRLFRLLYRDRG